MNRLGIQSLNAGAPDLRLSGDQTQRGTYTQRRRTQMAGGGITNARQGYLLGGVTDFLGSVKDKIVDDLIPNEIKENPVISAVAANYLPLAIPGVDQTLVQMGMDKLGLGDYAQTNAIDWLGNLLSGGSQTGPTLPGITGPINPHADTAPVMRQQGIAEMLNYMNQQGSGNPITNFLSNLVSGDGSSTGYDAQGKPKIEWQKPLAIGTAIGAADYLTRSDDTMPAQLGLDTSRFATAEAAKADPNLRFKPQEAYTLKDGGRIGYADGMMAAPKFSAEDKFRMDMRRNLIKKLREQYPDATIDELYEMMKEQYGLESAAGIQGVAQGGRIGYRDGESVEDIHNQIFMAFTKRFPNIDTTEMNVADMIAMLQAEGVMATEGLGTLGLSKAMDKITPESVEKAVQRISRGDTQHGDIPESIMAGPVRDEIPMAARGGRIRAQEGGLMDLGGMEKDYRQEGGFVPIGAKEKADDVPARLSKNEFVFTADAVRNAGGGDIDEGAAVMERLMENLEAGGKVSEDSQGLEGAQEMFANTQRLQNRII